MHYTGGIIDHAYLGHSNVLATYSYDTAVSLGDQTECCIQGCIRMEQGNWMEEDDESIIRRSIFLGISIESDEAELNKITSDLGTENYKSRGEEELSILIAKRLRYFADQFEAEFQKNCGIIQPRRDKIDCSLFSSIIKNITDIVKE
ncbi:DNA-directed RNA polymerase subunit gamma [Dirofilaria immitis]